MLSHVASPAGPIANPPVLNFANLEGDEEIGEPCDEISLAVLGCERLPRASKAEMVKLVDTPGLGSGAARCAGSSPVLGISPPFF